jgi:hypothetical protein
MHTLNPSIHIVNTLTILFSYHMEENDSHTQFNLSHGPVDKSVDNLGITMG